MGKKVLKIPLDDLFDILSGKSNMSILGGYPADDCFPNDGRIISAFVDLEIHRLCLVIESKNFEERSRDSVLPDVFLSSLPKEVLDE